MSFIYDALKRAEDDNQQRVTAPVRSAGGAAVLGGRSRWWAWALIAVLGVNALLLGAWIGTRGQRPAVDPRAVAIETHKPPRTGAPAVPIVASVPAPEARPTAPRVEIARPVSPPSSVERSRVTPPPASAGRMLDRAAPAAPLSPPVDAPHLTLQVLVYAEAPAQRMVFIDGKRYAEGDLIDAETSLERINADGVVVRRGGQRFVISDRRP